jgi:hypothetical protein
MFLGPAFPVTTIHAEFHWRHSGPIMVSGLVSRMGAAEGNRNVKISCVTLNF